jgi:plasmid stability protein
MKTITLRDIPEPVYDRLRDMARVEHRSHTDQLKVILEAATTAWANKQQLPRENKGART